MTVDWGHTLQLVEQAQGGDDAALNRLLERYYPRVKKIVHLRLGASPRRRYVTEDILQTTFATAVRELDRFEMRDERALVRWLARIAQGKLKDAYERETAQKRDQRRDVGMEDAVGQNVAGEGGDVLSRLVADEEMSAVERALAGLDDEYRELIILRNYEGLSFAEIAKETGRPSEGAARMKHATAMVKLTQLVREMDDAGNSE